AAVVASPTVYAAALGPDKFGLLADTADAWEDALCRLIEDQALRFTLAARWAKRVRERHSLPGQAGAWPRAWANLIGAARARLGLRRGPPLVAHGMYRG
ncbi:MAG TPA: glycosyltransferase, partial [Terriglobales bacterium]|nr:glycosyltransferase [Terriglobales bacterium]